jgi:thiol-disulfide isomerase/thioredoxin
LPSTIERVHQELRNQGLVVLAINLSEKRDVVAAFVRSRGVTATVLLDANKEAEKSYQIAYTPTVFLVDRQGKLVGKAIGERLWAGEQGLALLRRLLARPG